MQARLSTLVATLAHLFQAGATLGSTPQVHELRRSFPVASGQVLRLANLSGQIQLVPGSGPEVVVEAVIHAQGANDEESQSLLSSLEWVEGRDEEGHPQWMLSYPVEHYRAFHYASSRIKSGSVKNTYGGKEIRIHSREGTGIPTLYADLRIAVPEGVSLVVRNVAGPVHGGRLEGRLVLKTGTGDVSLDAVNGELAVTTGEGAIHIGHLSGNGTLDTGSGAVEVGQLATERLAVRTGSGEVSLRGGEAAKVSVSTGAGNIQVQGVQIDEFLAATGDGDVVLDASLARARHIDIGTGTGDVRIAAEPTASFALGFLEAGDLAIGYADAVLSRQGGRVVGARRADGKTRISIRIGQGKCSIVPKG